MAKKEPTSIWLVAQYLRTHKKCRICDMKRCTNSNNVGERVRQLRKSYKWSIDTVLEGYAGNIAIYYYQLKEIPVNIPKKYK